MISIATQQIHVTRITPITSARAVWFGDRTLKLFVSVLLVFLQKRSSMFRWHTNPTQLPLVSWQFCFHFFLVYTIKLLHDQGLPQCVCGLLLHAVGQQPSETGRQSRALCDSQFDGVWCVCLPKWYSSQGLPDGHARPEKYILYCNSRSRKEHCRNLVCTVGILHNWIHRLSHHHFIFSNPVWANAFSLRYQSVPCMWSTLMTVYHGWGFQNELLGGYRKWRFRISCNLSALPPFLAGGILLSCFDGIWSDSSCNPLLLPTTYNNIIYTDYCMMRLFLCWFLYICVYIYTYNKHILLSL